MPNEDLCVAFFVPTKYPSIARINVQKHINMMANEADKIPMRSRLTRICTHTHRHVISRREKVTTTKPQRNEWSATINIFHYHRLIASDATWRTTGTHQMKTSRFFYSFFSSFSCLFRSINNKYLRQNDGKFMMHCYYSCTSFGTMNFVLGKNTQPPSPPPLPPTITTTSTAKIIHTIRIKWKSLKDISH